MHDQFVLVNVCFANIICHLPGPDFKFILFFGTFGQIQRKITNAMTTKVLKFRVICIEISSFVPNAYYKHQ